jgi:hypothetical protein
MERRTARPPTAQAAAAALLLAATVSAGCSTTIVPPAEVADPVTVVLLDFGRTPGLALPGPQGAAYYVYGDWNFYALRNTGVWDGMRAMFWPTRGTLGRRRYETPLASPETMAALAERAQATYPIVVSRGRALALRERLDREFEQAIDTRVFTASLGREFVQHPTPYTGWHNSNHQVRDWLRELGCETRGAAFLSSWRVDASSSDPRPLRSR